MSRSTISTFQLFQMIPDAESARIYLEARLWPKGAVCPSCRQQDSITPRKNGFYRCNPCKYDFTVRTGTIFERSHVPLHKWVYAMYLLVTARKGISSLQLAKEIGITQKSAWFVLQRLREACGTDTRKLKGVVEVDEIYIGGKESSKHMRDRLKNTTTGTGDKLAVLAMRERGGKTKAVQIEKKSGLAIRSALRENVEAGSTIHSDEFQAYKNLRPDYQHESVNHGLGEYSRRGVTTNGVESVFAVLRRGLHGVYHKASEKHIGRYVNEFAWRLSEGHVQHHTLARLDSLIGAVTGRQITYEELIADNGKDAQAQPF